MTAKVAETKELQHHISPEEEIEVTAYSIWEADGRRHKRDWHHWYRAIRAKQAIANMGELMQLDPDGFDVVFEEVATPPFEGNRGWGLRLEEHYERFGVGRVWRGSLYWAAEMGQCGGLTLFVGKEEAYIERVYIDDFLRRPNRSMRGFSYYLLASVVERWPNHRITFHPDQYSKDLWQAVEDHGVIERVSEASDVGEWRYAVVT